MKEGLDTVRTKVQALTSKVGVVLSPNYVTAAKLLLLYGCSPYILKKASHLLDICMLPLRTIILRVRGAEVITNIKFIQFKSST